MIESVDIYENNMRSILDYESKNGDPFQYRKGCSDRFISMKSILKTKNLSVKKNKYLSLVDTLMEKYEPHDLDAIIEELIKELTNLKKESFNISVKTSAKVDDPKDYKVYEKILEYAMQYRLYLAKISYFYLDSISISSKEPYTIKLKFQVIKK